MSKQVKVGVVGCGYWGPNLVRNFRSLPDCHLKAMCDISQDRLKHLTSLYPEVKGETNFDYMLSGAGLDAVVSASVGDEAATSAAVSTRAVCAAVG